VFSDDRGVWVVGGMGFADGIGMGFADGIGMGFADGIGMGFLW
jgi:hypothetical protein